MAQHESTTVSFAGQTLGHYHILEQIGAGGMGDVYRALDLHLDREVAVKVLPAGALADETARKRFRREALALSRLNHPNIETVHDFDTQDGVDLLVIEYVPGTSLDARVAGGAIPESEVIQLGIQLCQGLAAAHQKGIIHRDLKPANLRLTPEGRLKILDFGLASLIAPLTPSAPTLSVSETLGPSGTLPYMAPEQVRAQKCDERTDIHAVGAILYELVTGKRAFPQAQMAPLIEAVLHEMPPTPRHLKPELSEGFESIVVKALDKDPGRRYQTARELTVDLERLQSGAAAPVRVTPRPAWLRWRKASVVITAVLTLALILILVITSRQQALSVVPSDFVLIGDFDNQTGDPVFDKSLSGALSISLEQTRIASIYGHTRVAEVLKRMRRPVDTKVDEALAQEIATREGIKIAVLPAIAAIGDNYHISARLHLVGIDRDVRTESVRVKGKDSILDGIDKLASGIRRDLGESLANVSQNSKPLTQATTKSLAALKEFSIAQQLRVVAGNLQCKEHYENALRLDPDFTSAKAALGILHVDQAYIGTSGFDASEGKRLLTEAIKNIDDVTDVEKYGILAFYAFAVEHDADKALSYDRTILSLHPELGRMHSNMGWILAQIGRTDEAAKEYETAIRMDPRFLLPYFGVAGIALYQGQPLDTETGLNACRKVLAIDNQNPPAWDCIGWASLGKGDWSAAEQAFRKAIEYGPANTLYRYRLAHALRYQRKYAEAVAALAVIPSIDKQDLAWLYDTAVNLQAKGDTASAKEWLERYLTASEARLRADSKSADNWINVAAALSRLGRLEEAISAADNAISLDPSRHFDYASVLVQQGRRREALDQLELAVQKGFRNFIWLKIHCDFQPLYAEPRFQQIMARGLK